jgi:ribosomal protein S4
MKKDDMNIDLSELLSVLLVRYELAPSDFIAEQLITSGKVLVDKKPINKKDYRLEKDSIVSINGVDTKIIVSTVSGQFPVTHARHEVYKMFCKAEHTPVQKSDVPIVENQIDLVSLETKLKELMPTGSKLFDTKIGFCLREIERLLKKDMQ